MGVAFWEYQNLITLTFSKYSILRSLPLIPRVFGFPEPNSNVTTTF